MLRTTVLGLEHVNKQLVTQMKLFLSIVAFCAVKWGSLGPQGEYYKSRD